jgi:hypothetical protein
MLSKYDTFEGVRVKKDRIYDISRISLCVFSIPDMRDM